MASPASPGAPPPPPRRASSSVSGAQPVARVPEAAPEPSPDSDAAPTIVRSEPPPALVAPAVRSDPPPPLVAPPGMRSDPPPPPVIRSDPPPPLVAPIASAATAPPPAHAAPVPLATAATGPLPVQPWPSAATSASQPSASANASSKLRAVVEQVRFTTRESALDAQAALRRGVAFLDAHDAWVPSKLRGKLRGSAWFGAALGTAAVAAAVGAFVLTRLTLPEPVAAPSEPVAAPSEPVKLRVAAAVPAAPVAPAAVAPAAVAPAQPAAKAAETPPSLALTQPAKDSDLDEGSLLLNSANTFTVEGRDAEAVSLIERALLRNPELRSDPRVAKALLRTSQSEDNGSVAATFALLEGPMGERGAELIYELSLAPVSKQATQRRVQSYLRGKQFAKNAALPLFVLVKLRQAKTCEDKHALLGLAAGGNRQTLSYLRELESHTTCAADDLVNCYPCMRSDNRLSNTIAALEKRIGS